MGENIGKLPFHIAFGCEMDIGVVSISVHKQTSNLCLFGFLIVCSQIESFCFAKIIHA